MNDKKTLGVQDYYNLKGLVYKARDEYGSYAQIPVSVETMIKIFNTLDLQGKKY